MGGIYDLCKFVGHPVGGSPNIHHRLEASSDCFDNSSRDSLTNLRCDHLGNSGCECLIELLSELESLGVLLLSEQLANFIDDGASQFIRVCGILPLCPFLKGHGHSLHHVKLGLLASHLHCLTLHLCPLVVGYRLQHVGEVWVHRLNALLLSARIGAGPREAETVRRRSANWKPFASVLGHDWHFRCLDEVTDSRAWKLPSARSLDTAGLMIGIPWLGRCSEVLCIGIGGVSRSGGEQAWLIVST